MKILSIVIAASIALTTSSFAGKKPKAEAGAKGHAGIGKIIKGFDTNGNHSIDGEEVAKLKAAYPSNADIKPLDKNSNGAIDDDEIAAVNDRMAKRAEAGKGKAGKEAGKGAKKKAK